MILGDHVGIVPYAGQGGRLFVGGIVIPAKL